MSIFDRFRARGFKTVPRDRYAVQRPDRHAAKLPDRFELRQVLARGGSGVVYRAWDRSVKREVAVKAFRESENPAAFESFRRECAALANLHSPNIVEIYEAGEFAEGGDKWPYLVLPLLKGTTLDKLIAKQQFTPERVVEIASDVCSGLQTAHNSGIVHGDLKPSNILISDENTVKIIDFGIARLAKPHSRPGLVGTPNYMAPEQFFGYERTPASDIYSLGVVCFECLTGQRPFPAVTERDTIEGVLHVAPPAVSELNPAVSWQVSRVIARAMAKSQSHRFSTAKEFAEALQHALHGSLQDPGSTTTQLRIQQAKKVFEHGEYERAREILSDLEHEGLIDPAIAPLREEIDRGIRVKTVNSLLVRARCSFEQGNYASALKSLQKALAIDPGDRPTLRGKVAALA